MPDSKLLSSTDRSEEEKQAYLRIKADELIKLRGTGKLFTIME
jgi:hypothetical protein